jgi:hypothetical protein
MQLHKLSKQTITMSSFPFTKSDYEAVELALGLARKCLQAPGLEPCDIMGLARAIYALGRLPASTPGVDLTFMASISSDSGSYEWGWSVCITEDDFRLTSGGSTWSEEYGGDSISGYLYEIETGGHRDFNGPLSSWIEDIDSKLDQPFEVMVDDGSTITTFDS